MWERQAALRPRFRSWRRGRPFWAGVFGMLAALWIAMPVATIKIGTLALTLQTLGGMSAALISTVLACCAISMWVKPEFRVACGIVTIVAALVSLPNVNLGGFFIGLASGLISGALALAWSPGVRDEEAGPEEGTGDGQSAGEPQAQPARVQEPFDHESQATRQDVPQEVREDAGRQTPSLDEPPSFVPPPSLLSDEQEPRSGRAAR